MRTQTGERQMLTPSTNSLIRGALQTTLALLAAASCGGWFVLLAMFVGVNVDMAVIFAAFWALTVLYGLLAIAIGNTLGRRQGKRGIAAAVLGSLLTWGILEFFFYLYQIASPEMRVPLIIGVASTAVGAAIGTVRKADREALHVELREELQELERDEDEE
jgi:hypothetical protein